VDFSDPEQFYHARLLFEDALELAKKREAEVAATPVVAPKDPPVPPADLAPPANPSYQFPATTREEPFVA
jgi:hypothetical protein